MLQTLELNNIRSYKSGLFEFSDGVNIIVGPNASGKTNLLEAICMSCKGSAFKSSDIDMISRDSDWGRIDMQHKDIRRSVKLQRGLTKVKSFVIEDVIKKRLNDQQTIPVVVFEPYDMLLLGGEPDRRRSYIDGLLSQTDPSFAILLQEYKRTLLQRNKLLKQQNTQHQQVFVWNIRLSDLGGKVAEARHNYILDINETITEKYQNVSGGVDILNISYDSKNKLDQYSTSMLARLEDSFTTDKIRGYTGSGPHRDDIRININDNDVRTSASRGEARSIVLALKISELELVEKKSGKRPILLLDDVFSELDGKRRRMLAQSLQNNQAIITTTDADVVVEHFSQLCNIIPL